MPAIKPSVLLTRALALFGSRGQRWCQGHMHIGKDKKYPNGAYCSIGAISKINTSNQFKARDFLEQAIREQLGHFCPSIILYNDARDRTFSEIRVVFRRAIAIAKAAGQ